MTYGQPLRWLPFFVLQYEKMFHLEGILMDNSSINTLITVYAIPLIGLIVAILTYTRAIKERDAKSAAELAALKLTVETMTSKIEKMQDKLDDVIKGNHNNEKNITELFTRVNALEARTKKLEAYHHGN